MASTSTNKQHLLIDRVFNNLITSDTLASGSATSINIEGSNASAVLVDCTTNDGGIIEDLWTISRSTTPHTVLFYLSTAVDYLRATEGVYVGEITTSNVISTYKSVDKLPAVLAPVPQVGSDPKNSAFYVPSGKALWATVQAVTPITSNQSPIIGAQGGFY